MAEKTETQTKPTMMDEIAAGGRSQLAVVREPPSGPGFQVWQPPPMTQERKEFLKRQFTPTGCSDLEFEFFLAYCERTGLDPVIKQAYLVERKQKVFKNGTEVWVSKFEPMSAEAGMAARADALPDYRGIDDGVVYEGDTFEIDYAAGVVKHSSNPLKRGRLIGAWAHVHREGRRVPITWLRVEERVQTKSGGDANFFWAKMAPGQILKCARAEQWRQAFPNIFGGQYVPEEMEREEIDVTPPNAQEAARPTADKLADKIKPSTPASSPPKTEAKAPPKAGGVTIDVQKVEQPPKTGVQQVEDRRAAALADTLGEPPAQSNVVQLPSQQAAKETKPDPTKVTVFGDHPGQPISEVDGPKLLELIALGESKFPSIKNQARRAEVRASIDAMVAERKRREDALIAESEAPPPAPEKAPDKAREPGEDDGEF